MGQSAGLDHCDATGTLSIVPEEDVSNRRGLCLSSCPTEQRGGSSGSCFGPGRVASRCVSRTAAQVGQISCVDLGPPQVHCPMSDKSRRRPPSYVEDGSKRGAVDASTRCVDFEDVAEENWVWSCKPTPVQKPSAFLAEATDESLDSSCALDLGENVSTFTYLNLALAPKLWRKDEAALPIYLRDEHAIEEALAESRRKEMEQDRREAARRAEKERKLAEGIRLHMEHQRTLGALLKKIHCDLSDKKASDKVTNFLHRNKFPDLDVNVSRQRRGDYPLHVAAEKGDKLMVSLLLKRRADPGVQNSGRQTPADVAAKKNRRGSHDEILAMLESVTPVWKFLRKDLDLHLEWPHLRAMQEQGCNLTKKVC